MLEWIGKRYMRMQTIRHEEQGFTLIELLVVVIIIGILAAIAIPTFLAQRKKAQEASCESDTRNAATAAVSYGATTDGDFTALTGAAGLQLLIDNGFRQSENNVTSVTSTADTFTITTQCVPPGETVVFDSDVGHIVDNGF